MLVLIIYNDQFHLKWEVFNDYCVLWILLKAIAVIWLTKPVVSHLKISENMLQYFESKLNEIKENSVAKELLEEKFIH